MATLPDTSVWIEFLRSGRDGPGARLDDLLSARQAITCGPVAAELAGGIAGERRAELWRRIAGLSWATLDRAGWLRVAEVKHELDRAGEPVALVDLQIAVTGARAGAEVWSLDSGFERIAARMPELALVST